MFEKYFEIEDDHQEEAKNQKFQNACRIWFRPAEDRTARELREMPQDEREKVWADLSGNEKASKFRKEVIEDPKEIEKAMEDMKAELESIHEKEAFELARKQSSTYVNLRSFQLMFLRSCENNRKRAANKLVEHMQRKKQLFGESVLGRDIKLSDLNADDMETLYSGGIQFLQERDNAGRLVLFGHVESLILKERENLVSTSFLPISRWYSPESFLTFKSYPSVGPCFIA
jgi:hypothetical protein